MLVIGLTGSIGSGKSTVANLFAKHGVPIIDADILARQVTEPHTKAYEAIIDRFGNRIINADGSLDRSGLREIIFTEPKERHWLEALLHPLILERMQKEIAELQSAYCIAVIPLLLETEAHTFIQRILVVDIPETTQLERAALRDNATHAQIKSIINTQIARDDRLAKADDIINNAGTLEELAQQVDQLHQKYLALSSRAS